MHACTQLLVLGIMRYSNTSNTAKETSIIGGEFVNFSEWFYELNETWCC